MSVWLIIQKLSKIKNRFSPNESNTYWQNDEIYQIKTRNDKITVTFAVQVCHMMYNYRLIGSKSRKYSYRAVIRGASWSSFQQVYFEARDNFGPNKGKIVYGIFLQIQAKNSSSVAFIFPLSLLLRMRKSIFKLKPLSVIAIVDKLSKAR